MCRNYVELLSHIKALKHLLALSIIHSNSEITSQQIQKANCVCNIQLHTDLLLHNFIHRVQKSSNITNCLYNANAKNQFMFTIC